MVKYAIFVITISFKQIDWYLWNGNTFLNNFYIDIPLLYSTGNVYYNKIDSSTNKASKIKSIKLHYNDTGTYDFELKIKDYLSSKNLKVIGTLNVYQDEGMIYYFVENSNIKVLTLYVEKNAIPENLMNMNRDKVDKDIIRFAIKYNNYIYYFEDIMPEELKYLNTSTIPSLDEDYKTKLNEYNFI